jgi:hypothetical protein
MKNKKKVLWIALVAVIAFSITACSSPTSSVGGGGSGSGTSGGGGTGTGTGGGDGGVFGSGGDWIPVKNTPFDGPEYGSVTAIAYGNNKFVASGTTELTGGGVTMAYSHDGITWTTITEHPFKGCKNLDYIVFGDGIFVAVGMIDYYTAKIIAYSFDGITWTTALNPFGNSGYINGVVYGNGKFVIVHNNDIAYSSTYGATLTWTLVPDTDKLFGFTVTGQILAGWRVNGIIYGNNKFLAIGENDYENNGKIATSSDGVTWTSQNSNSKGLYPIIYGKGNFVGKGSNGVLATSTDSTTWTKISMLNNPFEDGTSSGNVAKIIYGNNKFLAVGVRQSGKVIAYSTDGTKWTEEKNSTLWKAIGGNVLAIAYGNGRFVVGSSGLSILMGNTARIAYLLDN